MKAKNLISSLLCGLFVFAGQQAYANTYYSNQSNTPTNGLNYVQTDLVKLAKKSAKDENKGKDTVKDVKKDEVKSDVKDNSEDGTNPLSFENLVTHNGGGNDHCKSKKGNECNEGDGEENHDDDKCLAGSRQRIAEGIEDRTGRNSAP